MDTYTIIRSKRKTIAIQITSDGQIILRCPLKTSVRQLQQFVKEKEVWIQKHIERCRNTPVQPTFTPEYLQMQKAEAEQKIPERCATFAKLLGVTYNRITIRCQRSRWGSCSSKGNLNFNCLLMLMPTAVQDYVVVHELCHLLEMNHSSAFWRTVSQILPDYEIHRKWLKINGSALIARLPKS